MDLTKALYISAAGMKAEGTRLKVIAENLANADSTAPAPGEMPYRRKTVTFENVLNRQLGVDEVKVASVGVDTSAFQRKYEPGAPGADSQGYVLYPNVNPLIETMDMQEAQRTYEANLNVVATSKSMLLQTINLLRS